MVEACDLFVQRGGDTKAVSLRHSDFEWADGYAFRLGLAVLYAKEMRAHDYLSTGLIPAPVTNPGVRT
jgi:hypothetical protein